MKKFGFFYVVDVPEYSATHEQSLMKQFYDLDEDTKDELAIRRHNPANKNAYRGNTSLLLFAEQLFLKALWLRSNLNRIYEIAARAFLAEYLVDFLSVPKSQTWQ